MFQGCLTFECLLLFVFKSKYNILFMKENQIASYNIILKKHQNFLKKFTVFPQKTRKGIYVELLQLPLNHEHFIEITKPYPLLPEHTIDKQVSFIVAAFTRLYPDLGNQWLPGLIHPFVKLFKEDAIAGFEVSLSFLLNWYHPIFNDYPNPSRDVINVFTKYLPKLEKKINQFDYPLSSIIQPMMLVCLTDILSKQDSLQVIDFLVANPFKPELFICIPLQILLILQEKLCRQESVQAISALLKKQKNLKLEDVISGAVELAKNERQYFQSLYQFSSFPICKGRYPIREFIKKTPLTENKALERCQEDELGSLKDKFKKLQRLINGKLQEGMVADSKDINDRYRQVEGQMREYLKQIKNQHQRKLETLRELEENFKRKINQHGNQRQNMNEQNLDAIERRGRLERQILMIEQEANSIREAELSMMRRMEEIGRIKKDQLQHQNRNLKREQKDQKLF